jgi:hypothetical protein
MFSGLDEYEAIPVASPVMGKKCTSVLCAARSLGETIAANDLDARIESHMQGSEM